MCAGTLRHGRAPMRRHTRMRPRRGHHPPRSEKFEQTGCKTVWPLSCEKFSPIRILAQPKQKRAQSPTWTLAAVGQIVAAAPGRVEDQAGKLPLSQGICPASLSSTSSRPALGPPARGASAGHRPPRRSHPFPQSNFLTHLRAHTYLQFPSHSHKSSRFRTRLRAYTYYAISSVTHQKQDIL